MDLQVSPLQDAPINGSVVLSGIDITSRRQAEEHSRRLGAIIDATPDYVALGLPDGTPIFVNPGGRRLLSDDRDRSSATDPVPAAAPNLLARLGAEEREALAKERLWTGESVLGIAEGRQIPVSQVLIAHTDQGEITSLSTIMRDMSEQQRHVERQTLLMRELSHRVKNTLAVIQGMARQTLRTAESPQAFAESFLGRISSLSASHALLTERDWSAPSLREVIHSQLRPLLGPDRPIRVDGPVVLLPAETATQFGLVIHELGTNAIKHGVFGSEEGELSIEWTATANGASTSSGKSMAVSDISNIAERAGHRLRHPSTPDDGDRTGTALRAGWPARDVRSGTAPECAAGDAGDASRTSDTSPGVNRAPPPSRLPCRETLKPLTNDMRFTKR